MLTSRAIISKKNLRILWDSEYLNCLLAKDNSQAKIFLNYQSTPYLELLRTQESTEQLEIQNIPEVVLQFNEQGELKGLNIYNSDTNARSLYFRYSPKLIKQIGTHVFEGQELTEDQLKTIQLVLIQATLQDNDYSPILSDEPEDAGIFVTNKEVLLKNRSWFESKLPVKTLNIVTFDEAKEIASLFLKYRKLYYLLPNYKFDKGLYYLCSFRSKVPYYHFSNNQFESFARRFIFLLNSIDEIGFQYYSGSNNNTMDNTIYHFNYFITLITGIFDSLAIYSNEQYELGFKLGPMISLHSKSGDKFLRKLRQANENLREHIIQYNKFIKLIYLLREEVVHRDMLTQTGFHHEGYDEKWSMNFIEIDADTKLLIKQCKDKKIDYQLLTDWGLYEISPVCYLEPFHFAKAATRNLIDFSNKYLELSGFNNFIVESQSKGKHDQFIKELEIFDMYELGF